MYLALVNAALFLLFGLTENEVIAVIGAVSSLGTAGLALYGQRALYRLQASGRERDRELRRLRREIASRRRATRVGDSDAVVIVDAPERAIDED